MKFSRVNSVFLYTSRKDGATKGKVKNNKQLPLFRMKILKFKGEACRKIPDEMIYICDTPQPTYYAVQLLTKHSTQGHNSEHI